MQKIRYSIDSIPPWEPTPIVRKLERKRFWQKRVPPAFWKPRRLGWDRVSGGGRSTLGADDEASDV